MNDENFLPFTRPSVDEQTIAEVAQVLRSGWLTTGPRCEALEAALSARWGGRPVRLASSGTATLELALRLCDIGADDEVITTPLSWVATANVILAVGATPVFVDVDPHTRNIDLVQAEAAVTARTRAIIPVDLAGLPVDRDALNALAHRNGVRVIEDAAQSFGARWGGREIGSFGDLVSFSFHANKNLTAAEGGCLVLRDEAEAAAFQKLRLQGVERVHGVMDVQAWGTKANLTDVAATIALGQLRQIDGFNQRRLALARRYFMQWRADWGFELPPADVEHSNWHMFQPLLPQHLAPHRQTFIDRMKAHGIGVGVHYPAMHLFSLFRGMGFYAGQFPVAEDIGRRTVTLPLFPAMADRDVDRVCGAVQAVLTEMA